MVIDATAYITHISNILGANHHMKTRGNKSKSYAGCDGTQRYSKIFGGLYI